MYVIKQYRKLCKRAIPIYIRDYLYYQAIVNAAFLGKFVNKAVHITPQLINYNVYSLSPCADVSWPEFPLCPLDDDEDDDEDDADDRPANLAKCDCDGPDSINLADKAIFLPAFDTASPDADTSYVNK